VESLSQASFADHREVQNREGLRSYQVQCYNVQAAPIERIQQILGELKGDIIALEGTQRTGYSEYAHRKLGSVVPLQACEQLTLSGYQIYEWPYRAGARTTKAAGVMLALRLGVFTKSAFKQEFHPPPNLQGRAGAIRLRQAELDICPIVVYFPTNPSARNQRIHTEALCTWITTLLSSLPERCMPLLLGDFNARLGYQVLSESEHTRTLSLADFPEVGTAKTEQENYNGQCLHRLMHRHHLCAVNTFSFSDAGATYYKPPHRSRVDFVIVPKTILPRVESMTAWRRSGHHLQVHRAEVNFDHVPLNMRITLGRVFPNYHTYRRANWSFLPMEGADKYKHRIACFTETVEQNFKKIENLPQWQTAIETGNVHEFWNIGMGAILPAATEQFATILGGLTARNTQVLQLRQRINDCLDQLHDLRARAKHDLRPTIIRMWRLRWKLKDMEMRLSKLRKKEWGHYMNVMCKQINVSAKTDIRDFWRGVRRIGSFQHGPKQRNYSLVPATAPSLEEWLQYLSLPGKDGGCLAQQIPAPEVPFRWLDAPRLIDDHFVTSTESDCKSPGYSPPSVVSQAMTSHDARSSSNQVCKSPGCSPLSVVSQAMKSHDQQIGIRIIASGMEVGLQTASDPGATAPGVATTKICDSKTSRLIDDHFVTSTKSDDKKLGYSPLFVVSQAMKSHDQQSGMEVGLQTASDPGATAPGVATTKTMRAVHTNKAPPPLHHMMLVPVQIKFAKALDVAHFPWYARP
jgi:endonuclease/exonuclease/phosphatase family metal-dependent hydrolase